MFVHTRVYARGVQKFLNFFINLHKGRMFSRVPGKDKPFYLCSS